MTTKPFSTYPEDREKLLELCKKIDDGYDHEVLPAAYKLAELVKTILEDEKFTDDIAKRDAEALDVLLTPRHISELREEDGAVLWWKNHKWWTPSLTNDQVSLIQKRIEIAEKARNAEANAAPANT